METALAATGADQNSGAVKEREERGGADRPIATVRRSEARSAARCQSDLLSPFHAATVGEIRARVFGHLSARNLGFLCSSSHLALFMHQVHVAATSRPFLMIQLDTKFFILRIKQWPVNEYESTGDPVIYVSEITNNLSLTTLMFTFIKGGEMS